MNQSRLQTYNDCPRRFYFKHVADLDTGRPQIKLELGSGVHEGLAWLGAGESMEKSVQMAKDRFLLDFKDMPLMPEDLKEINDSLKIIEGMLPAYIDHWSRTPWTPLGQEVGGEVSVGKIEVFGVTWEIVIVFRLDKLVTWNHQLWLVDHKTAAKLDLRDVQKYSIDVQMTAYTYAATKVLEAQAGVLPSGVTPRVQGVIVDMLVKTKVPQFHREPFFRTDEDLVEFQYDWLTWSETIIRSAVRSQEFEKAGIPAKYAFAKNTKNCYLFGNCPYLPIEGSGDTPEQRQILYVKRREDYVDDPSKMKRS